MLTKSNATSPFSLSTKPKQPTPLATPQMQSGLVTADKPFSATTAKPNPIAPATPPTTSAAKTAYVESQMGNQSQGVTADRMNEAVGGTPTVAAPDPLDKYRSAMDEYLRSLTPSEELTETQRKYDNLSESIRAGISRQEDAAIPMEFIAGRQREIERRGTNLLLPLEQELSRRTAAEGARSEALKSRLDFEKFLYDEMKPADREAFELSEGQSRYEYNPETGQYEEIATKGKTYAPSSGGGFSGLLGGGDGTLSPLAQAVQNGTIALDKIPIAQRSAIAAELATSGISSKRQESLKYNMDIVDKLLGMDTNAITGAGQNPLNALGISNATALNTYNQLRGILSLENRQLLQGSGAISDFEFRVLSDAATALGRNLPNAEFRKQLQNVRDVFAGKYAHTRAGSAGAAAPAAAGGTSTAGVTPSGLKYTIEK